MKRTFYAILVLASPLLAQSTCPLNQVTAPALTIFCLPTREFGQPELALPLLSNAPNLVEGRELLYPSAIAFDYSVNPPRVYISDTGNNRVLGWSNANSNGTGTGQANQGNFADMVLGQSSMYGTFASGPGTSSSTGLNSPTGIAVDASGNVYVADSGNNRILRFKTPYKLPAGDLIVDLVIGQKGTAATNSNSNNQPNQGLSNASATSLYLSYNPSGLPDIAGMAFDGSGNLWVSDPGNNRVLRFPASSLTANNVLPAADRVLGQTSFTGNQLPQSNATQLNLGFLDQPTGLSIDSNGNLYVSDAYSRVLVYPAPLSLGENATKVLGVTPTLQQGQTPPTYPTSSSLGNINSGGGVTGTPQGVFVLNGSQGVSVFVADSPQNRVVRYDTTSGTWQVQAPANSPVENGVIGQPDYVSGKPNQGLPNPGNQTLDYPVAGAINTSNNEMWVVDQFNHRVLAFASQGGGVYNTASRVLGQADFTHGGANLIEGRELWLNGGNNNSGGGIVIDGSSCTQGPPVSCSGPPHLYIADTVNNRVLGFKDARNVGTDTRNLLTQKADIVIGQTDLLSNLVNSPGNSGSQPTATGLSHPVGLVVDASGNLYVADSGNGRVVRFPAPFSQPAGAVQTANLVLGQPDFVTVSGNVNAFSMAQPYGLAFFANGSLAVSDEAANRVVVFAKTGGDFTNGEGATLVVGQPNFNQVSTSPNTSNSGFNSPRHIAVDSSDRLYVCDYSNQRLMVFSKPTANDPSAVLQVAVYQPEGVIVSFLTGRIWVTSFSNNGEVVQLPEFQTLQNTVNTVQGVLSYFPLAVALDPFDNLVVADSANRVTFYFGQLFYRNTANYSAGYPGTSGGSASPTPTMLAEMGRLGSSFNFTPTYSGSTAVNLSPPWPASINNVQITVAGIPAPIFRLDPSVAYFEIPNGAPTAGPADFVVSNPSTGQILAVGNYTMQAASPGLYTSNSTGTGLAAVSVYDSNNNYVGVNSPSVPVQAGNLIGLWLTGAGNVPGLPADGTAPGTAVPTPLVPTVLINGINAQVEGSAMSSQFPGVWQINVFVPKSTVSSSAQPTSVVVLMNDIPSNVGGTTNTATGGPGPDQQLTASNTLITTIYVK